MVEERPLKLVDSVLEQIPRAAEDERPLSEIIAEKQELISRLRSERIEREDAFLETSAQQRATELLDYIRRGRLADGIEIMPQVIDAFPKILGDIDNSIIDLTADPFDMEAVKAEIVEVCQGLERDVIEADRANRELLAQYGIEAAANVYIDEKRFRAIQGVLQSFRSSLTPAKLERVRTADPRQTMIDSAVKRLSGMGILAMSPEAAATLLNDDAAVDSLFEAQPAVVQGGGVPLREFILQQVTVPTGKKGRYNPDRNGFQRIPRLEDYDGEIIEPGDINLEGQRLRSHLGVIRRGDVPPLLGEAPRGTKIEGATIIDGNVGYTEEGDIRDVEGLVIIDHHDQLETRYNGRLYDTATTMVTRLLSDKLGAEGWGANDANRANRQAAWRRGVQGFLQEFGASGGAAPSGREIRKLIVYVNHLDSDSVLATSAYRQPRLAVQYREIITRISQCGDFLLGSAVMEHGATARDYEYIIRGYLEACKAERLAKKQEVFNEQIQQANNQIVHIAEKCGVDPENIQNGFKQAIKAIEDNDPQIAELRQRLQTVPGPEKKAIGMALRQAQMDNVDIKSLQLGEKEIQVLQKKVGLLTKERGQVKVDEQDNTVILNHMLDRIEDIIQNPFKYQRFLMQAREREEETVQTVNDEYRAGEREIRADFEDDGILIMESTNDSGNMADIDSIDGLYFAFRQREDWNKLIIVTKRRGGFQVAINTQNAKHLAEYDFNRLINIIKPLEEQAIQREIDKLLGVERPSKQQKKQLASLQGALQANREGKLWRNRTQMIFCTKTFIHEEQVLRAIRDWKKTMEAGGELPVEKKASAA